MAEDKKAHRVSVMLNSPEVWKSQEVADTIYEMIMDLIEDDKPFSEVNVTVDPLNSEAVMPDVAHETLELVSVYMEALRIKAKEYGVLDMLREGLETVEHGVTDLRACLRCLEQVQDKFSKSLIPVKMLDMDNIGEAPEDILHAIAHRMGLDPAECEGMNPEDFVEWIKNKLEPKRTLN